MLCVSALHLRLYAYHHCKDALQCVFTGIRYRHCEPAKQSRKNQQSRIASYLAMTIHCWHDVNNSPSPTFCHWWRYRYHVPVETQCFASPQCFASQGMETQSIASLHRCHQQFRCISTVHKDYKHTTVSPISTPIHTTPHSVPKPSIVHCSLFIVHSQRHRMTLRHCRTIPDSLW